MALYKQRLQTEIRKPISIGYQLFLPSAYDEQEEKDWPLIVFLHGINRRGEDLSALDGYGLPAIAESRGIFKFVVAAPQCGTHSFWPIERDGVMAMIDHLVASCRIDERRIYLTGFSMGGNGAWDLAARYPERFAAVAPLSGWYQPEAAALLKDVPIWAFHGEDDDVVPVSGSRDMVQALQAIGGNIAFTSYPRLKHSIMSETYRNTELYQWFLRHERRENPAD
ncbi:Phospholipase/Carboxylesterase [Paenibacillus sp. BC26]|nr:Phospholipase/Carboxylesterase [Paenibacillus sp. BC26]